MPFLVSVHAGRRPLLLVGLALILPGLTHAQTTTGTQPRPPAAAAPTTATPATPPTSRRTVTRSALEFNEEDKKLLAGYKLTTDRLTAFETTTRKLQDAAKRDPGMRAQFEAVGAATKGRSLAEAIARIESTASPGVAALFKEANTTARDFVLTSFSLVNAAMSSGGEAPPPAYVPAENVAFIRSNRARIEGDFRSFQGAK